MGELEIALGRVKALSPLNQRKIAAVLGALVADAASQPLHWVYREDAMEKALEGAPDGCPEFLSPPANPYYHIDNGEQSPYGDQLMVLLESLATCKGFDEADYCKRVYAAFGPGSAYDSKVTVQYHSVRDRSSLPLKGKWRNRTQEFFVANYAEGKSMSGLLGSMGDENDDPDSIARLPPLVALLAGCDNMLDEAEKATLCLQACDMTVAVTKAACRVMERYILGDENPVECVMKELRSAGHAHADPLDQAVASHLHAVSNNTQLSVASATKQFGKA